MELDCGLRVIWVPGCIYNKSMAENKWVCLGLKKTTKSGYTGPPTSYKSNYIYQSPLEMAVEMGQLVYFTL